MTLPSKSQINKCGELVRQCVYEHREVDPEELEQAINVITDFRSAHSYPLQKVRLGLDSMIRTEQCIPRVSQRLKRVPRIIRKLQRTVSSPGGRTTLARLEDIGGVRAVLQDGNELERVRSRLEARWGDTVRRRRDYIADPKDIGYRAVHIVAIRDGRPIEIQLRTRGQQQWADAAESADARLAGRGVNLKDSDGPDEMIEYFAAAGELIYRREYGLEIPSAVHRRFSAARRAVVDGGYYKA
ncbi:MAG: RelA/SpoT domain-containing protein [Mycolicibacter algericus]|uniref:RelA/SpoT domain-containing protein n=1 Tax=Mycolicibacter algericus TaxID=1288388 RepID=UPI003C72E872